MTPRPHLADLEYEEFRRWLLAPTGEAQFRDPGNRRLVDVFAATERGAASALELAVLLRQHARRWAIERQEDNTPLITTSLANRLTPEAIRAVGLVIRSEGARDYISAVPWEPRWLDNPSQVPIDEAATAGTERGERQRPGALAADPIFTKATAGFSQYKTPGQRAAVRMVLETDPRGVMIANLPTGSGKTEVVVTLAKGLSEVGGGTVVMVVPTIALAQDLEARFRQTWARSSQIDMTAVPFAWTSETPQERRAQLRERVMGGTQPIIVTSPESLTGPLLETVRTGAANGRIRALVVDEAHLISQWGRSFRPEFRVLGNLWRELDALSGPGVRALLLSATLGSEVIEDLVDEFATPLGPSIVAANAIRSEPRFWVAGMASWNDRSDRVLEALAHLPRPCILYVTQPKIANEWLDRLTKAGYRRLVEVTGESSAGHRRDVLNGIRTRDVSRYDIVVATSAFGLGIDADEIRTVIHSCVPETADRWYQEVGRAGRDGYASTALLLPSFGDIEEALSLGVRYLTPDVAEERWAAMWVEREERGAHTYVRLGSAPAGKLDGSYNRRWNAQILDGLEEYGLLSRMALSWDENEALGLPMLRDTPAGVPDVWQRITLRSDPPDSAFFQGEWAIFKSGLEHQSLAAVRSVSSLIATQDACSTIESAYLPSHRLWARLGPDAVRGFGTSRPCGRCQACSRSGYVDLLDPAPGPGIRWAGPRQESRFGEFVSANPFGEGTPVGRLDSVAVVADSRSALLGFVDTLVAAGARLGVGKGLVPARHAFTYFDEKVDPLELLPLATVISCDDDLTLPTVLSLLQLRPTGSAGQAPVLVHVQELPRDFCARRPLSTTDARQLLTGD